MSLRPPLAKIRTTHSDGREIVAWVRTPQSRARYYKRRLEASAEARARHYRELKRVAREDLNGQELLEELKTEERQWKRSRRQLAIQRFIAWWKNLFSRG